MSNVDVDNEQEVIVNLPGIQATKAAGEMLTSAQVTDYNSFEKEWIQMMKTVNSLKKDDAKVIVTTIYNPAGNMKLPSTLNKIVEDIIENMNAIIEKRAGKYDYEIADVYQSSVTSHLQKDGVHPDSQGQQIIADLVCKEYEK